MEVLGIAGRKQFVDVTLPPGMKSATYQVQAFRSTAHSPVALHTVSFSAPRGMPAPGRIAA